MYAFHRRRRDALCSRTIAHCRQQETRNLWPAYQLPQASAVDRAPEARLLWALIAKTRVLDHVLNLGDRCGATHCRSGVLATNALQSTLRSPVLFSLRIRSLNHTSPHFQAPFTLQVRSSDPPSCAFPPRPRRSFQPSTSITSNVPLSYPTFKQDSRRSRGSHLSLTAFSSQHSASHCLSSSLALDPRLHPLADRTRNRSRC